MGILSTGKQRLLLHNDRLLVRYDSKFGFVLKFILSPVECFEMQLLNAR